MFLMSNIGRRDTRSNNRGVAAIRERARTTWLALAVKFAAALHVIDYIGKPFLESKDYDS